MQLKEIIDLLDCDELVAHPEASQLNIEYGYSCDLMSDVLAFVQNNVLLLTGLLHPQVIRTAEMLDIPAILFVRGKLPNADIIAMAKEREIVLLQTNHSLFTASGLLHEKGLLGEEIAHDDISL